MREGRRERWDEEEDVRGGKGEQLQSGEGQDTGEGKRLK